ncbi:MAG: CocE/NonD family hydrolase [Ignavibacteriales bacterium]|nr:CocE/NonD family hydrolase [Ignavibacteriales bacterium]
MKKIFFLLFFSITVYEGNSIAQQVYSFIPLSIPTRVNFPFKKSLAADLYSLDTNIAKPVIFIQTPYNKNLYRTNIHLPQSGGVTFPFDSINYNYVIMDWRGFYGSILAKIDGYDRGLDGYDAIEWIANQKWCNGKIGTYGASALGLIQFQTARHHPPHLICAVPLVKDYKTSYNNYYYGGDYRKEHVESLAKLGFLSTEEILAHPKKDFYWNVIESSSDYPEEISIPVLMIGGWFDHFPDEVIRAFNDLYERSDVTVLFKHKFLIGPWLHSGIGKLQQGEIEYPNAFGYPDSIAMQFFNYYLRNESNSYDKNSTIIYYQLGEDEWHSTNGWNSISTTTDTLFLCEGNLLSFNKPFSEISSDSFYYDPKDPSPAIGGARFNPFITDLPDGPIDISNSIEIRNDVLIFSTESLSHQIKINGNAILKLFISSNRKDTDFALRLCDVYPDNRSIIITQGIRRMRFRSSYSSDSLMIPGKIYPVEIQLQNIALTIKPGHKLRIVISSSIYPHFDINLNNGDSLYVPGDTLIANNYVYFNKNYPSCLVWQTSEITAVPKEEFKVVENFKLEQNFPNPFNPTTKIGFRNSKFGFVSLKVYDILGNEVATLVNEEIPLGGTAGSYEVEFSGSSLPSGIYFYRITTSSGFNQTKKMILLR